MERVEPECKPQRAAAAATCFCLFQLHAVCLMGQTSKRRRTSETDCFWFFFHFSLFLLFFLFALYLHDLGEHGSRVTLDDLSRHFSFFFSPVKVNDWYVERLWRAPLAGYQASLRLPLRREEDKGKLKIKRKERETSLHPQAGLLFSSTISLSLPPLSLISRQA